MLNSLYFENLTVGSPKSDFLYVIGKRVGVSVCQLSVLDA